MSEDQPEIETFCQMEAVCPHCGHVGQDTAEYFYDNGGSDFIEEAECGECEKKFTIRRDVTVDYTTEKIVTPAPLEDKK